MKKTYMMLLLAGMLLLALPQTLKANQKIESQTIQDAFLTTLAPSISEGIIQQYGYLKSYRLNDASIVSMKRNQKEGFDFTVQVEIKTFENADNPPYGTEKMTFQIQTDGVALVEVEHEGDEEERKVNEFYKDVLMDITHSFHLNVLPFEKYTYPQLQYQAEQNNDFNTLQAIVEDIVINILNPGIQPPNKNVILPVTYLKETEGYIVFKKSDGTNMLYVLKNENGQWQVVDKKSAKGKKMKADLLWYM
ncbi:DUF3888 domain-containing protein [Sporosarcina cyprini]|uniref:DUF3888 domain-containing protein n=1 Tax=Sporosarcina cyprini TaxID=2910523 RepID=UPI001EDCEE70|nr:DUF3888 domain-containing protein [Sporosarcina cyprini]MCG3086901.1 DUF3888 domain-containing protein [Sporosarcina cyprini]